MFGGVGVVSRLGGGVYWVFVVGSGVSEAEYFFKEVFGFFF